MIGDNIEERMSDVQEEIPEERDRRESGNRMVVFTTGVNAFTYVHNRTRIEKFYSLNLPNLYNGILKEQFKPRKHLV